MMIILIYPSWAATFSILQGWPHKWGTTVLFTWCWKDHGVKLCICIDRQWSTLRPQPHCTSWWMPSRCLVMQYQTGLILCLRCRTFPWISQQIIVLFINGVHHINQQNICFHLIYRSLLWDNYLLWLKYVITSRKSRADHYKHSIISRDYWRLREDTRVSYPNIIVKVVAMLWDALSRPNREEYRISVAGALQ